MKIAVAIPAFNCEAQIGRVLTELDSVLTSNPQIGSVFIIENRSSDNTLQSALQASEKLENRAKIEIYQNPENFGLGGTHKVAFSLCKSRQISHLILLHGDHQATPSDIPALLKCLSANPECNVLGSRFMDLKRLSGYSIVRTLGNLALNFLYSMAAGKKISDLGSGLNIFNIELLDEEIYQQFDNSFTFNMDLLLHFVRARIPICYVPISWSTSDQISNAKALSVGSRTLKKLIYWIARIPTTKDEKHFNSVRVNS
jgi:glycosyltransferase involved in cell wall biosynthesis